MYDSIALSLSRTEGGHRLPVDQQDQHLPVDQQLFLRVGVCMHVCMYVYNDKKKKKNENIFSMLRSSICRNFDGRSWISMAVLWFFYASVVYLP